MEYSTHYVHAISPRTSPEDDGPTVSLAEKDLANRKTLGAALRKQKLLVKGDSIREFRVESQTHRVVIFPAGPSHIWHAIVLTPSP